MIHDYTVQRLAKLQKIPLTSLFWLTDLNTKGSIFSTHHVPEPNLSGSNTLRKCWIKLLCLSTTSQKTIHSEIFFIQWLYYLRSRSGYTAPNLFPCFQIRLEIETPICKQPYMTIPCTSISQYYNP